MPKYFISSKEIISPSVQDYLKHIFDLEQSGSIATTTDLASKLDVSPASVTGMLQRLASCDPPLVIYVKHQGATLTDAGKHVALQVIRHHRLLEAYLVQALGYGWDEVHEEACRLEHVVSEVLEERMAAALGHPQRDPHGALIPDSGLYLPVDNALPLGSLQEGETAVIRRVRDEDPELLRYLQEIGVVPERHVTVLDRSSLDGNLSLRIEGQDSPVVLGEAITRQVFVEKSKNRAML